MNRSSAFNTSESQIHNNSSSLSQKHKLVFLGDQSVGKTSIINRFIFDTFDGKDHPTVGIDFISKTLYYDDKAVKLQLWDTAGQERFRSLIPSYIRDCTIAIIVYDITNNTSFTNLPKWIEDVRNERGNDVIIIVVGNKTDLNDQRVISKDSGESFSKDHDTLYVEVSAKAGDNITNLFHTIASLLMGNENRVFMSERNMPVTTSVTTPNINLTSKDTPENENDNDTKNNCQC